MKAQTITIIGLGRVGASLGLAIKNQLEMNVVGYDENKDAARLALEEIGAIDQTEDSLSKAAAKADILVLTSPVSELELTLQTVGDVTQEHTLVLDLSPMKAIGLKWAKQYLRQGHYIGAVPILAAKWLDDGRTAATAATPDLFQDSLFALMPAPDADARAVETAVNFGLVIGARPYFIDAAEYDKVVQGTETLPGLMAVALLRTLQKSQSWADMLRVAGLSFSLAVQPLAYDEDLALMVLNDKNAVLHWLEALTHELNDLRQIIYESEPDLIASVMEQVSIERDRWLLKRQENEWDEPVGSKIEHTSMMGQLFGGFIPGRDKKED